MHRRITDDKSNIHLPTIPIQSDSLSFFDTYIFLDRKMI